MGGAASKTARRLPSALPKDKAGGIYRPVQDLGEYALRDGPSTKLGKAAHETSQTASDAARPHPDVSRPGARLSSPEDLAHPESGPADASARAQNRPPPSTVRVANDAARGDRSAPASRAALASSEKPRDIAEDGQDPHFLQMLRGVGPVRYGEPDAGRKQGLAGVQTAPSDGKTSARKDPLSGMWTARTRIAEEIAREQEALEASGQLSPDGKPMAPVKRKHLEMSEITALLDARKRAGGDDNAAGVKAVLDRYDIDPSVLVRLGRGVNTPTQTTEKDEHGNAKAVWRDQVD
ncbi:hypothetical protein PYCC9005_002393 [Savitreella phatthalungensis]